MKLFKLIYEIEENKNKISLFDKEFIFFHAKKCKIIINNKITSLKEEYQIHEKNVNKLKEFKIKLIIFSEHNLNLKYMFFKCSLKKFSIISSGGDIFENKINDSSNNSNRNIDNNFDDNKFRINYKDENLTITRKNEDPISIKTSFHHKYLNHIYLFQKENSNYSEKEHEKIIFNSLSYKTSFSYELNNNDDKSLSFEESSISFSGSSTKQNNMININNCLTEDYFYFLKNVRNISKKGKIPVLKICYMFYGCSSLISVSNISQFDLSKCKDISGLFELCKSLEYLSDISKWDTHNVENSARIFADCAKLKVLPDISNWNTNKINDMSYFFNGCNSLQSLPDISKWNTSQVTNMFCMFSECTSLESLPDISNWDMSKIENIAYLFEKCYKLCFNLLNYYNFI